MEYVNGLLSYIYKVSFLEGVLSREKRLQQNEEYMESVIAFVLAS